MSRVEVVQASYSGLKHVHNRQRLDPDRPVTVIPTPLLLVLRDMMLFHNLRYQKEVKISPSKLYAGSEHV